jgi:hypothetical protein
MTESEDVPDLVGEDLGEVVLGKAVDDAAVHGDVALVDHAEDRAVGPDRGRVRAESTDRQDAGAIAEVRQLVGGIVELHDALAVAEAAGDRRALGRVGAQREAHGRARDVVPRRKGPSHQCVASCAAERRVGVGGTDRYVLSVIELEPS